MAGEDLDKYVAWINEGKSFSEIREDLQKQRYSESQIKEMIEKIDDLALQSALGTQTGIQSKGFALVGSILLIAGIAVWIGLRSFLAPMTFLWIVVIPMASGASLIVMGLRPRKTVSDRRKFKPKF